MARAGRPPRAHARGETRGSHRERGAERVRVLLCVHVRLFAVAGSPFAELLEEGELVGVLRLNAGLRHRPPQRASSSASRCRLGSAAHGLAPKMGRITSDWYCNSSKKFKLGKEIKSREIKIAAYRYKYTISIYKLAWPRTGFFLATFFSI